MLGLGLRLTDGILAAHLKAPLFSDLLALDLVAEVEASASDQSPQPGGAEPSVLVRLVGSKWAV